MKNAPHVTQNLFYNYKLGFLECFKMANFLF